MKISTFIFSIGLIVLVLFNSTRVALIYAYYELDTVGFIEAFCINKDKPELECNGKCHLKEVSKTQDSQQKTPENIFDFKPLLLYPSPVMDFTFYPNNYSEKQIPTAYQNKYFFQNFSYCFHPPRV